MKKTATIVTITLVPFLLGLFSNSFLIDLTGKMLERKFTTMYSTPWEVLTPGVSLGILLALCSGSAYAVAWAYSKVRNGQVSKLVFSAGLLFSVWVAILSIWLRLIQIKMIFNSGMDLPPDTSLTTRSLNYLKLGWPIVVIYGIVTAGLLWSARVRKRAKPA